jgi:multidrug efflux pump subunit AcrA (membrane-fusion protein)
MKRALIAMIAVTAMTAIAMCACGGDAMKPRAGGGAARHEAVTRGDLTPRVLLTGELKAASAIDIVVPRTESWEISIRWLPEDGATVKTGDRLVDFDNSAVATKLEEQKLQTLEAEIGYANLVATTALDGDAKLNEQRQSQIAYDTAALKASVPADLIPTRDAQERQLDKKKAEIALEKTKQEVEAQRQEASLELRVKQIELEKAKRAIAAAEKTLDDLSIKAPRGGAVVIGVHPWEGHKFRVGDVAQPGMTVLSLPDLDTSLEVRADLSDVDDGRVAVGMTGTCTLDAYPREPIACSVRDLTPVALDKSRQSLRRAFALVLTLAKIDPARMRPGMSVKIELRGKPTPNVLLVPRGSVVRDKSGPRTRVRTPGGLREVTLGACDAQSCVVESGLAEKDVVFVGGGE